VTLAVVFKVPEGLALAVDSRVTLDVRLPAGRQISSYFDNATKLLSIQGQSYVGVVTYGMGAIGQAQPRMAHGFIPEFEAQLGKKYDQRAEVSEIARELGAFYTQQWQQAGMPSGAQPMVFLVAGFDEGDAYGRVYEVVVPNNPKPVEKNPGNEFGITWGGQGELVARLLSGVDQQAATIAQNELRLSTAQREKLTKKWSEQLSLPIPYQFLPLQDCVDLSAFLVNMTSSVQTWTVGVRGVGGATDVATITRTEGFRAIKQKKIGIRG
jgi:hypothetical protein